MTLTQTIKYSHFSSPISIVEFILEQRDLVGYLFSQFLILFKLNSNDEKKKKS